MLPDLARSEMTLLVVTHGTAFAREVADRLVFMDVGGDCGSGHPGHVLRQSRDRPDQAVPGTDSLTCPCPDCTGRGLRPSQSRVSASGDADPTAHPPKPRPTGLNGL